MKTSFKIRAAAMVASVATTFLVMHGVALMGYPEVSPDTGADQVARTTSSASGT